MMSLPTPITLPPRLADFLSGAYYAVSITVVLVGMLVWVLHQEERINELEKTEAEHPSKAELLLTEVKVEGLGRHIDDIDTRGTRAMGDRVGVIEQEMRHVEAALLDSRNIRTEFQQQLNKLNNDLSTVIERQHINTDTIKELRAWQSDQHGPSAPQRYPH